SLERNFDLRRNSYNLISLLLSKFTKENGHYALWEVIEFGDSYNVPANADPADSGTGRTITSTTEDMQKKKNDVKARTTLLLSL
nr:hypothetical protein [Tanacetum cinerariifolium]